MLTRAGAENASDIHDYPMARGQRCPFVPPPMVLELGATKPVSRVQIWDSSTPWLTASCQEVRVLFSDSRVSVDDRSPRFPHWNESMAVRVRERPGPCSPRTLKSTPNVSGCCQCRSPTSGLRNCDWRSKRSPTSGLCPIPKLRIAISIDEIPIPLAGRRRLRITCHLVITHPARRFEWRIRDVRSPRYRDALSARRLWRTDRSAGGRRGVS